MKIKTIKFLTIIIFIISIVVFFNSHQLNYFSLSAILMIFSSVVVWYIIHTSQKNQMIIKAKTDELELLTDNIPCGILKIKLSDANEIIYANQALAKIIGCSLEDIKNKFNSDPTNFLLDEDILEIKNKFHCTDADLQHYNFDLRLKKANGELIWTIIYGRVILNEQGEKIGIWVIFDNNEQKLSQDEIKIIARKYKVLAEYSESIIFEIDVATGNAEFNDNFKNSIGLDPTIENFVSRMPDLNIFHPEDISAFSNALTAVIHSKKSFISEVRMKHSNGQYLWYRSRFAPILDETGKIITVIGRISNIDKQKRETEHLIIKTMLDPLTNLNNKIATQAAIDEYLICNKNNVLSAMLAIDIDNFKFINDEWGHLFGDTVLTDIANLMKRLFRKDDIIGRFGGDEFVVFLKDIPTEDFAISLTKQLLSIFYQTYSNSSLEHKFSASIGISFSNKHGNTFCELYENADKALYFSKKNGKNQYCIYTDNIDQINIEVTQ